MWFIESLCLSVVVCNDSEVRLVEHQDECEPQIRVKNGDNCGGGSLARVRGAAEPRGGPPSERGVLGGWGIYPGKARIREVAGFARALQCNLACNSTRMCIGWRLLCSVRQDSHKLDLDRDRLRCRGSTASSCKLTSTSFTAPRPDAMRAVKTPYSSECARLVGTQQQTLLYDSLRIAGFRFSFSHGG